jgi:hypothetical protein
MAANAEGVARISAGCKPWEVILVAVCRAETAMLKEDRRQACRGRGGSSWFGLKELELTGQRGDKCPFRAWGRGRRELRIGGSTLELMFRHGVFWPGFIKYEPIYIMSGKGIIVGDRMS